MKTKIILLTHGGWGEELLQSAQMVVGKIECCETPVSYTHLFGHMGGAMSICDLLSVLYGEQMKYDADNPEWEERDWLICSKGHAGPAVYAALALKGFFPMDWLDTLNPVSYTHLDKAMQMLKAKLKLLKEQEQADKVSDIRGEIKEIGFGNQIRSYVMQPYTLVKDHRTGAESSNVGAVLDGALAVSYTHLMKMEALIMTN